MTLSLIGGRKRGRSLGDDESRDFTPLSKRINNLHINTTSGSCNDTSKGPLKQGIADPEHSNGIHWNSTSSGNVNGSHHSGSNPLPSHGLIPVNGNGIEPSTSGVQMMGVTVNQDHHPMPVYSPDLGIGDNPFYYESNKLLFHLYQERLQRSSHSPY